MIISKVIYVDAGSTSSSEYNISSQNGTCVGTIIPVSQDQTTQMAAQFSASFSWSVNNKFWIQEPICNTGSTASSGESLSTLVQAPYVRIDVTNTGSIPQNFFVTFNIPNSPS